MLVQLQNTLNKLLESTDLTPEKRKRLEIIKKLLGDDNCFFKIDITTAINILKDLEFSTEEAIIIYKELINSKNFK